MIKLLKKSKGLNSRLIELNKFDIREFKGQLSDKAKIVVPKLFKTVQRAKTDYKREMKNLPDNVQSAPKEFWEEIIEQAKILGIDLVGFAPVDEKFIFKNDYVG